MDVLDPIGLHESQTNRCEDVARLRSIGHPAVVRLTLAITVIAALASVADAQYGTSPYHTSSPDLRNPYDRARDGGTVQDWAKLLDSPDPKQRMRGVDDLGQSADQHAVTYLLKALGDADLRIQARAIEYLGARRASDATPLLVQKLFLAGAPGPLRQRVLTSLGQIGDPSASRPILDFIAQEPDANVRGTGIYALGEIGDLMIRDDLRKLGETEKDPRLKQLVDEALAKISTLPRPSKQEFVPPSSGLVPPVKPGP
jgi:HEAT repeats